MLKAPCKDCPNRKIGCHCDCENYKKYRIERDIFSEHEQRRRQIDDDFYCARKYRVRKEKRS